MRVGPDRSRFPGSHVTPGAPARKEVFETALDRPARTQSDVFLVFSKTGNPLVKTVFLRGQRKLTKNSSTDFTLLATMDRLHDTRAPFWTGIGTGSRARQVQDPNGGSRVGFRFWPRKKTIPSSSLLFLATKKALYLYPFLSCELPRSRSRQNSRARQRTDPLRLVNLKLEVAWFWTRALARRIRVGGSTDEGLWKDLVPEDLGEG